MMLAKYALPTNLVSTVMTEAQHQAQKLLPPQMQNMIQQYAPQPQPPQPQPQQPQPQQYVQPPQYAQPQQYVQQPMVEPMRAQILPQMVSVPLDVPQERDPFPPPMQRRPAFAHRAMNRMSNSRFGPPISNNSNKTIMIVIGIIVLIGVIVGIVYAVKASKTDSSSTASSSSTKGMYNTAMKDGNYEKIMAMYTQSSGFGNERNTAIVICGNLITKHASDVNTGALQGLGDADLHMILSIPDTADVRNTILYKIIPLYLHPTDMTFDGNYNAVVNGFLDKNGVNFGKDARFVDDNMRNTAIVIIGMYITKNSITAPLQAYSDAKLFKIMTSTSLAAVKANIATA